MTKLKHTQRYSALGLIHDYNYSTDSLTISVGYYQLGGAYHLSGYAIFRDAAAGLIEVERHNRLTIEPTTDRICAMAGELINSMTSTAKELMMVTDVIGTFSTEETVE
jgi:hypothetical protein